MKHFTKILIFLCLSLPALAQTDPPRPRQMNAEVRSAYRSFLREYESAAEETKKDPDKFILDWMELFPEQQFQSRSSAGVDNWGRQAILPDNIRTRLAQECKYPGIVRVGDTGASFNHDALQTGQQTGKNYSDDTELEDLQGHATHCSGILFADGFGVLNELAKIGLVRWNGDKVLNKAGQGAFSWLANHVNDRRPEDVANAQAGRWTIYSYSLGGSGREYPANEEAFRKSVDAGIFFAAAAGNTGGSVGYPGNSKYTFATASLDENLSVSSYSSRGPEVTIAMPGRNIASTFLNNQYANLSGTSMANPFAVAAMAVAKAKWGPRIPNQYAMDAYIKKIAKDLGAPGKDNEYGYGIALIQAILDTPPDADAPTEPEPPKEEPVNPPVTKPSRTLQIDLVPTYEVLWSNRNGYKRTKIQMAFDYTTTLEASQAAMVIATKTEEFFQNRGFMLRPNDDENDMLYWVARFYKMIVNGFGGAVEIRSIRMTDATSSLCRAYPLKDPMPLANKAFKRNEVKMILK